MISEVMMGLEIRKHLGASSWYPVHIINKHHKFYADWMYKFNIKTFDG